MIERVALHEAIVREVKNYIEKNNLKAGDRLPNQEEFTRMFGVSRTSLREALRTLQAMDIIDVKNGKGIFVKEKDKYKVESTITVENEKQLLSYILETRRAIEGLAARLAAQRRTDEDILELERLITIMVDKARSREDQTAEDKAFHYTIYRVSKNPVLIKLSESIYDVMDVAWQNPFNIGKTLTQGIGFHVEIFEAIKKKKPHLAEKAVMKIIDEYEVIIKSI